MNKICVLLTSFIFALFILSSVSATSVLLSDQGTDVKQSGSQLSSGDLTILLYSDSFGGTSLFNQTFSGAIINGSWNVMINPDLEFGKSYWKDYSINDVDLDFSGSERLEFTSPVGYINDASYINLSLIQSCPAGQAIRKVYSNGSVECQIVSSNTTDTQWNITGSNYIINASGILNVNETKLNQSIDARIPASGYQSSAAGWINDSTNTNTSLNVNILNGKNVTTTGTGFFGFLGSLTSRVTKLFVQDIDTSGNVKAANYTLNGTTIDDWSDVGGGSGKSASGPYLFNDSAFIYLNETMLNATIDARDGDATYSHLSNFTDNLGNRGYTSLSNFTNDVGYVNATGLQSYNETAIVNALNASKLDASDQRYNETALINSVNSSVNVDMLGFLNKSGTNANQNINVSPYNLSASKFIGDGSLLTNLPAAAGDGTGGWENTSTATSTALNVNLTTGNFTVVNGRVGIGTVSPSQALHVVGQINSTSNISTPGLCLNGDCRGFWPVGGSSDKVWNIAGSNYLINVSGVLDINDTKLNNTIDSRASVFNDTVRINAVNTTVNIQELGFYTRAEVDNRIMLNSSDNIYLNINPATRTISLNETKLNSTIDARVPSAGYQSSAAGWANMSTTTSTGLNVNVTGNVTANKFIGDGSLLTGITVTGDGTGGWINNSISTNTSLNVGIASNLSVFGVIRGVQTGNVIPFYYDDISNFPSASAYHGAVAHAHNQGALYYAHGGSWVKLLDVTSAYINSTDDIYLYSANGQVKFNETKLNATIDARIPAVSGDGSGGWSNTSTTTSTTLNVNITGNVTASKFIGDGSLLTNLPSGVIYTHLSNFTDNLGSRGFTSLSNFTNNLGFINSTQAQTFNDTVAINSLNTSKLDNADQRYNDTVFINAVNTSANVNSLGFLNKSGTNANQNMNINPYNITASHFIGDGSLLTGITVAGDGTGSWTNTSITTSTSLNVNVTGNVTANRFIGDGSLLTNLPSGLTYTHLSNFTDNLGNRGYTSLSNFTNDVGYITIDTNETTRFNALTSVDCPSGSLVIGVQNNGTVLCATDQTGGGTADGTGGWTNTSTITSTSLNLNLTSGNLTVSNGNVGIGIASSTIRLDINGDTQLRSQGDLRFADSDSSNYVAFQSPAAVASNVLWTLPSVDGSNGQVLTTNGTGGLLWSTVSSGGGGWTDDGSVVRLTTAGDSIVAGHTAVMPTDTIWPKSSVLGGASMLSVYAFAGDSSTAGLTLGKSKDGTVGNAVYVPNGEVLGVIRFAGADGYSGSYAKFSAGATVQGLATEAWSSTAHGTKLVFQTTANGATANSDRMTIEQNGNIGIGASNQAEKLYVAGNIKSTGNVTASKFIGDGSLLTGISAGVSDGTGGWANTSTTTSTVLNVNITGNVTAAKFIGDGSGLTNLTSSPIYTHLSNFTDNLGNRGYTSLSNFTNDVGYITIDTNETTRFNALVSTDCPSGSLVIGVQNNGTVLCAADQTGGGGAADGTGGWTNTSAVTSTSLSIGIGTSNPREGFQTNNVLSAARFNSDYGSASLSNVEYWGLQDDANSNGVTKGFVWRIDKPSSAGSHADLTLRLVQGFSNSCSGYPFCNLSSINGVGTDAVTFAGNGNVGIGTSSPGEKLHVNGNIRVNRGSTIGPNSTHIDTGTTSTKFGSITADTFTGMEVATTWDGSTNDEEIVFSTHNGGVGAGERLRIDKNGKVTGAGNDLIIMRSYGWASGDFGNDLNTGISATTYPAANLVSWDAANADDWTRFDVGGDGNWHLMSYGGRAQIVFYHKSIATRDLSG